MQQKLPNLADESFEPSDAQFAEITRDVARTVRWQKAMSARGVKVLELNLTPDEESRRVEAWERDEGLSR